MGQSVYFLTFIFLSSLGFSANAADYARGMDAALNGASVPHVRRTGGRDADEADRGLGEGLVPAVRRSAGFRVSAITPPQRAAANTGCREPA